MGCAEYSSADIGKAFACSIAAGLATILGSASLWFAPLQNNNFVAAALSFSAGVLLYVSIVDIYAGKAVDGFLAAGHDDAEAFLLATICFFSGMPIAYMLDFISNYFLPAATGIPTELPLVNPLPANMGQGTSSDINLQPRSASCSSDHTCEMVSKGKPMDSTIIIPDSPSKQAAGECEPVSKRQLLKVGVLAGLVIAFHNMPEGLVTFMAYLDSIQSGITTAIAIAIHNIPEGIVIAIPIYYATGNRGFAMLLSASSAFTEPLGALIGLAVACTGSMNNTAFGVVFGLVAGIMVQISVKELYPTARLMDRQDKVTTLAFVCGMIVMAASLVAIAYSDGTQAEAEPVVTPAMP